MKSKDYKEIRTFIGRIHTGEIEEYEPEALDEAVDDLYEDGLISGHEYEELSRGIDTLYEITTPYSA